MWRISNRLQYNLHSGKPDVVHGKYNSAITKKNSAISRFSFQTEPHKKSAYVVNLMDSPGEMYQTELLQHNLIS